MEIPEFKTNRDFRNFLAKIHDHLSKGEIPPGLNFVNCRQCESPTQYLHLMEEGICGLCWNNNRARKLGSVIS